jgi:hypothetical protein
VIIKLPTGVDETKMCALCALLLLLFSLIALLCNYIRDSTHAVLGKSHAVMNTEWQDDYGGTAVEGDKPFDQLPSLNAPQYLLLFGQCPA